MLRRLAALAFLALTALAVTTAIKTERALRDGTQSVVVVGETAMHLLKLGESALGCSTRRLKFKVLPGLHDVLAIECGKVERICAINFFSKTDSVWRCRLASRPPQ